MNDMTYMTQTALDWLAQGRRVALATVVSTWGSAPRPAGAQLVIDADGVFQGSVSGGCIEGAVVIEAQEAIKTGHCVVLEYGVADNDAFASGLACGGTIRVLVEPVGIGQGPMVDLLQRLVAAYEDRRAVALSVDLATWQRRLVFADEAAGDGALAARFRSDKSGVEGACFVAVHNPPLRLLIVGAVHIAQALVPMARLAGYDVTLCDPRTAFGNAARFGDIAVLDDWPDAVVAGFRPDARSALVTLAHDPKIDDPALIETLASDAFYIGCLGSRRTHAKRLERLAAAGVSRAQMARLHGPAGLDIGAQSPAEIALSVLAEMTARLRQNHGAD